VLQPGAEIGEDVLVIGPAVIGEGARLETGAIVAQSVVARNVTVPARAAVRHRVVTTSALPPLPSAEPESMTIGEHIDLWEEKKVGTAYPAVKRAIETLVAMVALALLSPLLMLVAALVKLDSRGPIFYGDPREGKGGKPFPCFKFRTMIVGAHAAQRSLLAANQVDGPQFKMAADPRVTRLGRWLRVANIDELPQLMNVVMGQMSLVGPRPSPFRENQTCVPWREARLSVRPGITGLWQVCRHERELGDFHQWIYYDIQYVRHMSPIVDLKIIVATVLVMLGIRKYFPLTWIIAPDPQEVALSQSIATATRVS
jgi:lipopolysaccharide/colanic/teichoic acid biosynthesis glycosyltransferase